MRRERFEVVKVCFACTRITFFLCSVSYFRLGARVFPGEVRKTRAAAVFFSCLHGKPY